MKKLAVVTLLVLLGITVFLLTLFHLVPASVYERLVFETVRERSGITLASASFDKAFPLGFVMAGLKASDSSGRALLRADSLRADLRSIGLVRGVGIGVKALAGGGSVDGTVWAGPFGYSAELEARAVGFSSIEALSGAGLILDGGFDGRLSLTVRDGCAKGFARLEGVGLGSAEVRFRGLPLPFDGVDEAGLSADFRDCGVKLNGLWLEGGGLSVRVQGDIRLASPLSTSPVDLTLEIVPDRELLAKEYLFSALSAYRGSANFYSVPLRGTLGSLTPGR